MRSAELWSLAALLGLASCQKQSSSPAHPPAAKVQNARPESMLTTLTLTEEAERRLGIEIFTVERRLVPATLSAPGEVVLPPGQSLIVTAPLAGTVGPEVLPLPGSSVTQGQKVLRLIPLPATADLASAQIRLEAAQKRRDRAADLLKDGAGSQRSLEEAEAELAVAQSNAGAGSGRGSGSSTVMLTVRSPQAGLLRDLHVGVGQAVAAGAALFQVDSQRNLWIRTSLYVGDIPQVDRAAPAKVHALSEASKAPGLTALHIAGPPSGNAEAASEDLFYQVPAPVEGAPEAYVFRPGQRVSVTLPLKATEDTWVVPWSSVLFDLYGSTWVYTVKEPHTYTRRKIQVKRVVDEWAVLDRGLSPGDRVVSVGAAELFGTEFGAGK